MGRAVVLGESVRVRGYALAGAEPVVAESPEEVRRAWSDLSDDVDLVVLTPAAAAVLEEARRARPQGPLSVEMTS